MAVKPDSGKAKSRDGRAAREAHDRAKKSRLRPQTAGKAHNKLAQRQNRWQRFVRYVWDKKKG